MRGADGSGLTREIDPLTGRRVIVRHVPFIYAPLATVLPWPIKFYNSVVISISRVVHAERCRECMCHISCERTLSVGVSESCGNRFGSNARVSVVCQ